MLKQSPSRKQRSKDFKVKHALQICLLFTICIWLLYHVKCSAEILLGKKQDDGYEIFVNLGRRSLHPRLKEASSLEIDKNGANEDEVVEEIKLEETEAVGREARDEDGDVHDEERVEEEEPDEVEDLIDEEDRERELEGNEEEDIEEKYQKVNIAKGE